MNDMARFFAALYLSEGWYDWFLRGGKISCKARALVLFDRVITEREGYK